MPQAKRSGARRAGASEPVASEPRERSEARLGVFVVEARRTRERVGGLGAKPPDQKKKGAMVAPFFYRWAGWLNASCRPFSCRPWLLSSPCVLSLPSPWIVLRGAPLCRITGACRHAQRARSAPSLRGGARDVHAPASHRRLSRHKKRCGTECRTWKLVTPGNPLARVRPGRTRTQWGCFRTTQYVG